MIAKKKETESMPTQLDQLRRKITQIEIELAALRKEKTIAARDRLEKQEKELESLKKEAQAIEKRWNDQKDIIQKIQGKRAKLWKGKLKPEISFVLQLIRTKR